MNRAHNLFRRRLWTKAVPPDGRHGFLRVHGFRRINGCDPCGRDNRLHPEWLEAGLQNLSFIAGSSSQKGLKRWESTRWESACVCFRKCCPDLSRRRGACVITAHESHTWNNRLFLIVRGLRAGKVAISPLHSSLRSSLRKRASGSFGWRRALDSFRTSCADKLQLIFPGSGRTKGDSRLFRPPVFLQVCSFCMSRGGEGHSRLFTNACAMQRAAGPRDLSQCFSGGGHNRQNECFGPLLPNY